METLSIMHAVGLLLCSVALGGMLFFVAIFAPLVFRKLPADTAGSFIRQLFPIYYATLIVLSGCAAVLLWGRAEAPVLAAVALLFVFSRFALMPRMIRARDASLEGDFSEGETFGRLHRLSAIINIAQIVAFLTVFVRFMQT
jgi:Domain of unknown function (DUF4149)